MCPLITDIDCNKSCSHSHFPVSVTVIKIERGNSRYTKNIIHKIIFAHLMLFMLSIFLIKSIIASMKILFILLFKAVGRIKLTILFLFIKTVD